MADTNKNIVITPNNGVTTDVPKIVFTGYENDPMTLNVTDGVSGGNKGIEITGSEGQVFSVTPELNSGSVYRVNDVSGLPMIEAKADGNLLLNQFRQGNVGIGTDSPNLTEANRTTVDIDGTNESLLAFSDGGTAKAYVYNSGGRFDIWSSNDIILQYDGTKNVGIGTVAPTSQLHVMGDINQGSNYLVNSQTISDVQSKQSYHFDGASSIIPEGVSATDDAPAEWKDGIATLDFWVKFDDKGSRNSVMGYGYWTGILQDNFYLNRHITDDKLHFEQVAPYENLTSAETISVNQWHHVAIVLVVGAARKMYIDGVLSATGSVNVTHLLSGFILGRNHINQNSFEGDLRSVRAYNRALSADEVKASYSGKAVTFADTGASQLEIYTANATTVASTGVYNWVSYSGSSRANVSNQMVISYVTAGNGAYQYLNTSNDCLTKALLDYTSYRLTVDAKFSGGGTPPTLEVYSQADGSQFFQTLTASMVTMSLEFNIGNWSVANTFLRAASLDSGQSITLDNFNLVQIGCVVEYLPTSIGASKWLDSSGNDNQGIVYDATKIGMPVQVMEQLQIQDDTAILAFENPTYANNQHEFDGLSAGKVQFGSAHASYPVAGNIEVQYDSTDSSFARSAHMRFKLRGWDDGNILGVHERITILSNGKVGIGNTSPDMKLDIAQDAGQGTTPPTLRITNTKADYGAGATIDVPHGAIEFHGDEGSDLGGPFTAIKSINSSAYGSLQSLSFYTKDGWNPYTLQDRMRIWFNGNVGINLGNTAPSGRFHVNGTGIFNGAVGINGVDGNMNQLGINGSVSLHQATGSSSQHASFFANSVGFHMNTYGTGGWQSSAFVVAADTGYIGVNTVAPTERLHVVGDAKVDYLVGTKAVNELQTESNYYCDNTGGNGYLRDGGTGGWIQISHDETLGITGEHTLELLINSRSFATAGTIFIKGHYSSSNAYVLTVYCTGNNMYYGLSNPTAGSNVQFQRLYISSSAVKINEWMHVVLTWDGTSSSTSMKAYINGVLYSASVSFTGSNSTPLTALPVYTGTIQMGFDRNWVSGAGYGRYGWQGSYAKVRMHNRGFTADDVKAAYSGKKVPYEYTAASALPILDDDFSTDPNQQGGAHPDGVYTLNSAVSWDSTNNQLDYSNVYEGVGALLQQTDLVSGKWYKASFTISNYSYGGIKVRIGDKTYTPTATAGNGDFVVYGKSNHRALGTSPPGYGYLGPVVTANGTTLSVDNFKVEQVGCIMELLPSSMGHNKWFDTSGNANHAYMDTVKNAPKASSHNDQNETFSVINTLHSITSEAEALKYFDVGQPNPLYSPPFYWSGTEVKVGGGNGAASHGYLQVGKNTKILPKGWTGSVSCQGVGGTNWGTFVRIRTSPDGSTWTIQDVTTGSTNSSWQNLNYVVREPLAEALYLQFYLNNGSGYSGNENQLRLADVIITNLSVTPFENTLADVISTNYGDATVIDGNLIIGTAGKGIDFSNQTPTGATGSAATGELLNHYEEGTWLMKVQGSTATGGDPGALMSYQRIGDTVHISGYYTVWGSAMTGATGDVRVVGLPYAAAAHTGTSGTTARLSSNYLINVRTNVVDFTSGKLPFLYIEGNEAFLRGQEMSDDGSWTGWAVDLSSYQAWFLEGSYRV